METVIREIEPGSPWPEDLVELLIDSVHGGASIGFLTPLSQAKAQGYWHGVAAALGDGRLLWVAQDGDRVVGSVQLSLAPWENGRHRAELQKLLVHSGWRRRGIARQLMNVAESHARSIGRTLLVLDTLRGSEAEPFYRGLGWQRAGEIPDYAAAPDGQRFPTVVYYRMLA